MEIISTTQKGKSDVIDGAYIAYNVRKEGENDIKEIHGSVIKDDRTVGFVAADCVNSAFQFSLNANNGLSATAKKGLYDAFVDDVEEMTTIEEE